MNDYVSAKLTEKEIYQNWLRQFGVIPARWQRHVETPIRAFITTTYHP